MKPKRKYPGLTLMEMTLVIATVALLATLSAPAVRTLFNSMGSLGSVRAMISAGLASAKAIAAREQRYAGIRFQRDLAGNQYMIFIVHDQQNTDRVNGFRAVESFQPIKLPENLAVMDLRYRNNLVDVSDTLDNPIDEDADINNDTLRDTTSFSIVFSPSGKLVIHEVRIRNKDGKMDNTSGDDVFNTTSNVDAGIGMFYQDDYPADGLGQELSRSNFVIYDRDEFKQAFDKGQPYSGYLWRVAQERIYINPYTGRIINR